MTEKDYKVGYGKPPKSRQFKKGQSGNPKGPPKSARSGAATVAEFLDEPVKVKLDGKERTISSFEASFLALAKKALKRNLRATIKFIEICEEYGVISPPPVQDSGSVVQAPPGVDFHEWYYSVTEEIPDDEPESEE